jgi:uracil phosphoribosyltransferase
VVHKLSEQLSVVSEFIRELRDQEIQKDRAKFRRNIIRIGQIAAYEISKKLTYTKLFTQSPMGIAQSMSLKEQPVIATILRAGLPLQQGINDMFDQADLAYVSAYRANEDVDDLKIVLEYVATPNIENRVVILCDPMLATGKSLVATYNELMKHGKPSKLFIVSVIGSKAGVEYLTSNIPDCELYIGVVDDTLDQHGYIIPGLGDAGDLSFGEKG